MEEIDYSSKIKLYKVRIDDNFLRPSFFAENLNDVLRQISDCNCLSSDKEDGSVKIEITPRFVYPTKRVRERYQEWLKNKKHE